MTQVIPGWKDWIDRPEVDRVVEALTSGESGVVVVAPDLEGVGGLGVTAVAAAALHRTEVIEHFHEGVCWARVGDARTEHWADDVLKAADGMWGKDDEPFLQSDLIEIHAALHDEEAARELMDDMFAPGPRLMAVDGLPDGGLLLPLAYIVRGCVWLAMVDSAGEAPPVADVVRVGPMSLAEGVALLRRDLPSLDEGTAVRLAELTGGWSLALTLAHSMILSQVVTGESANVAATQVAERLPRSLDLADRASREALIGALVDHSLNWLPLVDPGASERFLELGLFAEEKPIPVGVAAMMWGVVGMTGDEIGALIARLEALSLLERRTDEAVLELAPAVMAYVRDRLGPEGLDHARRRLIDADPDDILEGWAVLPGTREWVVRNLPDHYLAAGEMELLAGLVCDVSWIADRTILSGVEGVVEDLSKVGTGQAELLIRTIAASAHLLESARETGLSLLPTLACRLHAVPGKAEEAHTRLREMGRPWLESRWTPPDLPHPALLRTLHSRTDEMTDVTIAPDGTWLAGANADGRVLCWRVDGARLGSLLGHESIVTSVDIAADGAWLASAAWDGTVRLWDVDGTPRAVLSDHPGVVQAVAIAPDGSWLASAGEGFLRFWNSDGTLRAAVSGRDASYERVAIAPDSSWLAAVGFDVAEFWNANGTLKAILGKRHVGAGALAFAPGGQWLALIARDGKIQLLNPDGTMRASLDDVIYSCNSGLAVAPDGRWLAVSDFDDVILADVDGSTRARLPGRSADVVAAIAIAPGGSWLASAGNDRTIRIWDTNPAATGGSKERSGTRELEAVAIAPDGSWLATAGLDGLIFWDADGSLRSKGQQAWMCSVDIAADGGTLLTGGGSDGTVRLHETDGTVRRSDVVPGASDIRAAAIAPDGTWMAIGYQDRVRIMAAEGRRSKTLKRLGDEVNAVAIAPDSCWLAVAAGQHLQRWSTKGRKLGPVAETCGPISGVAIAPDGQSLAAVTTLGSVELFDLDGGVLIGQFRADEWVRGVAFSPDGAWLATTAENGCLRVWDVGTLSCVAVIVVDGALRDCAWFPDGSGLCAVGNPGLFGFTFHR
ncbi:hypothetical protein OHA25_08365 [Nonomuraea sp. NBC_00507]|uniref:hypothetical protein n=1 Tax=Nonomuraea sp. NBC_00507 TaxID=2976002 RepID=UPI002E17556F